MRDFERAKSRNARFRPLLRPERYDVPWLDFFALKGLLILAQGETLGMRAPGATRSEGAPQKG